MHRLNNDQRHIWLLSGTGEGPPLAEAFVRNGWKVTVSVVSSQASLPYLEMPLESLKIGSLNGIEGIKGVLNEASHLHDGFDFVVDATHPFAVLISSELKQVCKEISQPLLRFERPLEPVRQASVITAPVDLPQKDLKGKNILLALGARSLPEAVGVARKAGANVFARVLPTPESLRNASLSLLPSDQLAVVRPMQGEPVGEVERALIRRWSISDLLCRESGGLTQKLWQEICEKEKIHIWMISRPGPIEGVEAFHNFEAILARISIYQ